jgi:signal transduction histidine kinase
MRALTRTAWWRSEAPDGLEAAGHATSPFLSTLPAEPGVRRLALLVVLASLVLFGALAPFARVPLPEVWGFIPVYQSAVVINDLITAVLLYGQFAILGSAALLFLAAGYTLVALVAFAHLLSFPGLFSASGLLGAGAQSTAWLYMFWHSALPLGVIGYAATRGGWRAIDARGQRALAIAASIVAASCIAAALVQVATAGQGHLPPIMQGQHYTSMMAPVVGSVWMLNAAALAVLWLCRLRSVLDVCIMVALCAWLLDIALSAGLNAGRFDLGFYAGRVYGLFASCFVLFVLLLENGVLYARLARALDGERNERRRVQEKTEELRALNASLESRVSLRTAALDASNQRLRGAIEERLDAEEALRRSRAELHELAAVGTTAREQEKMRIARELHDELAQSLAMLIMDLGWLQERVGDGDGAIRAKIEAMRKLLSASVASTRRMASDLRPLVLDDFGLVAGIEWLVEKFSERYGVPCELRIVPRDVDVPDPYATAVFRILQETLTNVARHAHARHVDVEVCFAEGRIQLGIRDDGCGFDLTASRKSNSFGLVGLRERAYLIGGDLLLESAPGKGTSIELTIPMTA